MALFDPSPRTATATAVSETRLAGLKNESLNTLRTRPEVSAQLLQALARRLRRTNDSLSDLVFRRSGPRGQGPAGPGRPFRPPGNRRRPGGTRTHPGGARPAGGRVRETVNKALAEFVQRGWLRLEARAVVILDMQRLRQRSR